MGWKVKEPKQITKVGIKLNKTVTTQACNQTEHHLLVADKVKGKSWNMLKCGIKTGKADHFCISAAGSS